MAAFHARAEGGRCRTVAHRRFLMMMREFGMSGFHKANSGPAVSRFPTDVTDEMKLVK